MSVSFNSEMAGNGVEGNLQSGVDPSKNHNGLDGDLVNPELVERCMKRPSAEASLEDRTISKDPKNIPNFDAIPAAAAVLRPLNGEDLIRKPAMHSQNRYDPRLALSDFSSRSIKDPIETIDFILERGHPNPEQVKGIYTFFEKHSGSFSEFLERNKDRNNQFEKFLTILDQDLFNSSPTLNQEVMKFAFSSERFEFIQLQEQDIDPELIQQIMEFETKYKSSDVLQKIDLFSRETPGLYEAWMRARMNSSSSLSEKGNHQEQAINQWKIADELKSRKAKSGDEFNFETIQVIHKKMGKGLPDITGAGQVRRGMVRIGGAGIQGLPPTDQCLARLTAEFDGWLLQERVKCGKNEKSVILTAAQAYQRLVSIHPFENGNGRISRLVMDYVLERFGLPPAVHGKEIVDAVFALKIKSKQSANAFLQRIFEGVKKSNTMITS